MSTSGFTLAKLSFTTAFQVVLSSGHGTLEKLEWLESVLNDMMTVVREKKEKKKKRKVQPPPAEEMAVFESADEILRSMQS